MVDSPCIRVPELPDPLALTLPGGVTIEHLNLLDLVQPALAPLVPVFDIVDAIVAVLNVAKAIPKAIGPPPDLSALPSAIADLAQKVDRLLRLLPQLSVPLMLVGLLDLLIDTLRKARSELRQLQGQMTQIAGVVDRARALEDEGLLRVALCAESNVDQEAANVWKRLESLGRLIGLVNLFAGMVGEPSVPAIGDHAGEPLDAMIPPLDALIDTLQSVRDAVPLP